MVKTGLERALLVASERQTGRNAARTLRVVANALVVASFVTRSQHCASDAVLDKPGVGTRCRKPLVNRGQRTISAIRRGTCVQFASIAKNVHRL
jgi:hypothetical protein